MYADPNLPLFLYEYSALAHNPKKPQLVAVAHHANAAALAPVAKHLQVKKFQAANAPPKLKDAIATHALAQTLK